MEYVGIDLHKKESQICLLTDAGDVMERRIRTADNLTRGLRDPESARVLGVDETLEGREPQRRRTPPVAYAQFREGLLDDADAAIHVPGCAGR
jgi:hypothetical protein